MLTCCKVLDLISDSLIAGTFEHTLINDVPDCLFCRRAARSGDYFCHDVMTCNQMATAVKPVYGMRQIENIPGLMWSEVCRRYSRTARSLVIVRKFHIMFLLIKADGVHQEERVLQPQNFAGGKPLRCHFKSSLVHPRSGGKSGDLPFSHKLV